MIPCWSEADAAVPWSARDRVPTNRSPTARPSRCRAMPASPYGPSSTWKTGSRGWRCPRGAAAAMGQPLLPDIPNWCWHEYGMRVGFWRFLDVLNARRLKATLAVNGTACQLYARPARPRSTPAGNSWATGMCSSPCIAWPTRPRRSATPSPPSVHRPRARLGKPRPDGNRRHHRPAGRGGHRVRGRLGAGRPARAHQDALGRYPVGALYRGAQRRGDIGRAIARLR